jgi:hypothetical protein
MFLPLLLTMQQTTVVQLMVPVSSYQSLALLDNYLKYSVQEGAIMSIGYCMTH